MRTDSRKLSVLPVQMAPAGSRERLIARWTALLKPLDPPETLSISPEPIRVPLRNTSASTSKLVPTSSLFFKPIQALAGERAMSLVTVTVAMHESDAP